MGLATPPKIAARDTTSARKRRDPTVVRSRIVDAGIQLFADRGVERVNSNELARAAGVGVGSFYGHFRDKWELHQAIVLRALDELQSAVARVRAGFTPDDIEAEVRTLVTAVVDFALGSPDLFRVAFGREVSPPPTGRAGSGRPNVGYSTRGVERRIATLQSEGLLDTRLHPAIAARAFAAMQSAVVIGWVVDRDRGTREDVIETLVRLHPAVAGRVRAS